MSIKFTENQRIAARNHAKHDSFASRSMLLVTEGTVTREINFSRCGWKKKGITGQKVDFVVRYAEQKCTEKERKRLKIVELNKENMKKIRWLIAFSVLLYLGVQNLDVVLKYVKIAWGLLAICAGWSYGVCAECTYDIY